MHSNAPGFGNNFDGHSRICLCKLHILNVGYGINFRYEGMLAHSFDRFMWLQNSVNDLRFSMINFDETCDYLKENGYDHNSKEYTSDLRLYCKKIV